MCGIAGLIDTRFVRGAAATAEEQVGFFGHVPHHRGAWPVEGAAQPPGRVDPSALPAVLRAEVLAPVARMTDHLRHRGPDDAGLLVDSAAGLALGHRRLSIIDLSPAGHQPMTTPDGRFTLVFNGEIYNADELAAAVRARGRSLRGHADTEALLEWLALAIADAGSHAGPGDVVGALERVNGMFALALYDRRERSLWLARDRFGEKPLHYAALPTGRGSAPVRFAFASELRALLSAGLDGPGLEVDRDGLAEYLLLQYVHAPRTILRGVRSLEPGSLVRLRWGRAAGGPICLDAPVRWWTWSPAGAARGPGARLSARELRGLENEFEELLDRAVGRRMVSDVPLGAMLSGGVDSALVVSSMLKATGEDPATAVRTFSIGFAESAESEHEAARETAAALGVAHTDEVIAPDILGLMPEIVQAMDAPLGDSSCLPTWLLCRMIRRHVTVALGGDGGDELFGGYGRYADTLRDAGNRPGQAKRWLRTGDRFNPADAYCAPRWWMFMPETIVDWLGEWPRGAAATAGSMRATLLDCQCSLLARMRGADARSYMPGAVLAKVDRMSMAHGLEVRSPLLDPAIARFAERLPDDALIEGPSATWLPSRLTRAAGGGCVPLTMKRLLRRVLARRLPQPIAARPKRGFGLPSAGWSNQAMLRLTDDLLLSRTARLAEHVDHEALAVWVRGLRNPDCFSVFQVWTVLVLELWLQSTGNHRTLGSRFEGDDVFSLSGSSGIGISTTSGSSRCSPR